MSEKTVNVINKLNRSEGTIIAKTTSIGQERIEWSGNPLKPASKPITFAAGKVLELTVENGAGSVFDEFGYIKFPARAEFDFSGNHSSPGEPNPQINVKRSVDETRITLMNGKSDFRLELWFPETGGAVPRGEENVTIGDEQP